MPMSVQYGAASPLLHCKYRGVYDALSENIVDSSDYSDLSNHCSLYTVQFVQLGAKIQIDVGMGGDHFCRYEGVNLVQLLLIFHPSSC